MFAPTGGKPSAAIMYYVFYSKAKGFSMSRTFGYCRVSTTDQTVKNQQQEICDAGFAIEPRRMIEEVISGSVAAKQRPQFLKLLDRIEPGDVLVVTRLDRLGRNSIDIRQTVEQLEQEGVRVYCLALGGVDLTSPAGKLTMGVIAAIAEFERDLLIERTNAGLIRSRKAGKRFGRPPALDDDQRAAALQLVNAGVSISEVARRMGTSRQTILRTVGTVAMPAKQRSPRHTLA